MLLGTAIAVVTLLLQVWGNLIPTSDWMAHRRQWVASLVLPYLFVLAVDTLYRFATAPWRVHQDMERHFDVLRLELENSQKELSALSAAMADRSPNFIINASRFHATSARRWGLAMALGP
jgi:hypothetical protein